MNYSAKSMGVLSIANICIIAPLERIKLIIQNQSELVTSYRLGHQYHGVIDCVYRIYQEEGVLSFWNIGVVSYICSVGSQGFRFAVNNALTKIIQTDPGDSSTTVVLKAIFKGVVSVSLSMLVIYPFSYFQTQLATNVTYSKSNAKKQYQGIFDICKQTLKSSGYRGFYRGVGVACLGLLAYRGCYFGLSSLLTPMLASSAYADNLSAKIYLTLGITIFSGLISYPLDTICHRMMLRSGESAQKYQNGLDCAQQIIANEGFLSLYRGFHISLLKGFVGVAVLSKAARLLK